MFVITVELWPHGAPPTSDYANRVRHRTGVPLVMKLIIVNNETGTDEIGNYDVLDAREWEPRFSAHLNGCKQLGTVEHHPRGQTHRYSLIRKAVQVAIEMQ